MASSKFEHVQNSLILVAHVSTCKDNNDLFTVQTTQIKCCDVSSCLKDRIHAEHLYTDDSLGRVGPLLEHLAPCIDFKYSSGSYEDILKEIESILNVIIEETLPIELCEDIFCLHHACLIKCLKLHHLETACALLLLNIVGSENDLNEAERIQILIQTQLVTASNVRMMVESVAVTVRSCLEGSFDRAVGSYDAVANMVLSLLEIPNMIDKEWISKVLLAVCWMLSSQAKKLSDEDAQQPQQDRVGVFLHSLREFKVRQVLVIADWLF